MTDEEKVRKFEELQKALWDRALGDNVLMATFCAALIRALKIEGPNGEDPEDA